MRNFTSVCACVRARACVYPSHKRGTVIISSSPGQITPVHPLQKASTMATMATRFRASPLRHFAFSTVVFLSFFLSLSLSLLSFIIHLESMIKHDENRMGIESNGAKVLFFFEKLGIETPLSISSLVLFSSGAGDENVSPSLLLPGRR